MAFIAKEIMHMNDLRVGESIVCGESSRGIEEYGLLVETAAGCYLRILRADNKTTCIFKDMILLTNVDPLPYQALHRSGTATEDVTGFIAYPDLEFWDKMRMPAWFSMEPQQYSQNWDGHVDSEEISNLVFLLDQKKQELEKEAILYQLKYLRIAYKAQQSPASDGFVM